MEWTQFSYHPRLEEIEIKNSKTVSVLHDQVFLFIAEMHISATSYWFSEFVDSNNTLFQSAQEILFIRTWQFDRGCVCCQKWCPNHVSPVLVSGKGLNSKAVLLFSCWSGVCLQWAFRWNVVFRLLMKLLKAGVIIQPSDIENVLRFFQHAFQWSVKGCRLLDHGIERGNFELMRMVWNAGWLISICRFPADLQVKFLLFSPQDMCENGSSPLFSIPRVNLVLEYILSR